MAGVLQLPPLLSLLLLAASLLRFSHAATPELALDCRGCRGSCVAGVCFDPLPSLGEGLTAPAGDHEALPVVLEPSRSMDVQQALQQQQPHQASEALPVAGYDAQSLLAIARQAQDLSERLGRWRARRAEVASATPVSAQAPAAGALPPAAQQLRERAAFAAGMTHTGPTAQGAPGAASLVQQVRAAREEEARLQEEHAKLRQQIARWRSVASKAAEHEARVAALLQAAPSGHGVHLAQGDPSSALAAAGRLQPALAALLHVAALACLSASAVCAWNCVGGRLQLFSRPQRTLPSRSKDGPLSSLDRGAAEVSGPPSVPSLLRRPAGKLYGSTAQVAADAAARRGEAGEVAAARSRERGRAAERALSDASGVCAYASSRRVPAASALPGIVDEDEEEELGSVAA